MLTPYDITVMENTVHNIIGAWNTTVAVKTPLPLSQQPNWNKVMSEFTGEVMYSTITLPAERKDMQNSYSTDVKPNSAGEMVKADKIYAIPHQYNGAHVVISESSIFILDDSGDEYIVRDIRTRIGEYIVHLDKLVGGTAYGVDNG